MFRYLKFTSVLLSLLLHFFLYYFFVNFDYKLEFKETNSYNVSFVRNREQFISTNISNSDKNKNTPFKSHKDTAVKEESIKRGQGGVLPKTIVAKKSIPKKATKPLKRAPKQKSVTKKQVSKKLDLAPMDNVLDSITKKELSKAKNKPLNVPLNDQPFTRGTGQSASISGFSSGSIDYLPNIKDGDITFLNAKADKFAVFVRRVAIRVFQYLKKTGWESLSATQVKEIATWVRIIAAINLKGKLVEVKVITTSGSIFFDRVARKSVASGVVDPNPPRSAVAFDGNIRFIFYAKSWSEIVGGGARRGGGYGERRWLGLKAGLE